MTNSSPWKIPTINFRGIVRWENHLFLWAIYTMAMLNHQSVSMEHCKSWDHHGTNHLPTVSLMQDFAGASTAGKTIYTCSIFHRFFYDQAGSIPHVYTEPTEQLWEKAIRYQITDHVPGAFLVSLG